MATDGDDNGDGDGDGKYDTALWTMVIIMDGNDGDNDDNDDTDTHRMVTMMMTGMMMTIVN